jgi:hypothetical protein
LKRCLAAIPVDARPAVRSHVQQMAACGGWELRMPPVSLLGHLRRPGDRDALHDWLLDQAPHVDGLVLSLDMLVYGGLVPSRFIEDSTHALLGRLNILQRLRQQAPGLPIYGFAATMRISNSAVAQEEKDYWVDHGPQLWAWSHHLDRANEITDPEQAALSRAEVLRLEQAIPESIRQDYRATRQRNLNVTLRALQAVREGLMDRLVLPQDDTAEWGLNVAERRHLQAQVTDLSLHDRVAIYAGADEVMHTLCAHLVAQLEGRTPLRVALLPTDPRGLSAMRARYEDRPVWESVDAQMAAVGAQRVDQAQDADVLLVLHTQGSEQGDWALGLDLPQRCRIEPSCLDALRRWQGSRRPWALADLAYANGGDPAWLQQGVPLPDAYAGWNTASNTLGSVLAQCTLAAGRLREPLARRALSLRLLEDLLYQAELRQVLRARVDEAQCSAHELLQAARELVLPASRSFSRALGLSHCVSDLRLPWDRSFEVDLQLEALA